MLASSTGYEPWTPFYSIFSLLLWTPAPSPFNGQTHQIIIEFPTPVPVTSGFSTTASSFPHCRDLGRAPLCLFCGANFWLKAVGVVIWESFMFFLSMFRIRGGWQKEDIGKRIFITTHWDALNIMQWRHLTKFIIYLYFSAQLCNEDCKTTRIRGRRP